MMGNFGVSCESYFYGIYFKFSVREFFLLGANYKNKFFNFFLRCFNCESKLRKKDFPRS